VCSIRIVQSITHSRIPYHARARLLEVRARERKGKSAETDICHCDSLLIYSLLVFCFTSSLITFLSFFPFSSLLTRIPYLLLLRHGMLLRYDSQSTANANAKEPPPPTLALVESAIQQIRIYIRGPDSGKEIEERKKHASHLFSLAFS
jgi:hypothetical protein